ncbi:hypothetical protein GE061_008324 [Apolygus lucorum]|uniref:Uncharacterized protein n=1 Tax=Apolygus lucorum TaxID=248454 RepID=A0A8S9WRZ5_APOLU|nr:hypothetical protein GE061_008324 [Apolygus lucorum]
MRLTAILLGIFLLCHQGQSSFFDSLPLISQLKSLVQVISGDADGAKRTQENFVNTAAVVSQVKSLVHAIEGDNEAARKTQEAYADNLEELANSLPVVGHIKGVVHVAVGEKEKGEEIIKEASSTTGAMIGGTVAGPAGAILGRVATDALITGIDSAVHKESKPFGMVDYVININDKDAGEHFDRLFRIGLDAVGGAVAIEKGVTAKTPSKGSFKKPGSPEVPKYPDSPKRPDIPENPTRYGADAKHRVDNEESIHRFNNEESFNQFVDESHLDFELQRRSVNLEEDYQNRLEPIDFEDVNDVNRKKTVTCVQLQQ